ncbi:hypothetical protein ACJZ2D_016354 [Fusarium nematophilum]
MRAIQSVADIRQERRHEMRSRLAGRRTSLASKLFVGYLAPNSQSAIDRQLRRWKLTEQSQTSLSGLQLCFASPTPNSVRRELRLLATLEGPGETPLPSFLKPFGSNCIRNQQTNPGVNHQDQPQALFCRCSQAFGLRGPGRGDSWGTLNLQPHTQGASSLVKSLRGLQQLLSGIEDGDSAWMPSHRVFSVGFDDRVQNLISREGAKAGRPADDLVCLLFQCHCLEHTRQNLQWAARQAARRSLLMPMPSRERRPTKAEARDVASRPAVCNFPRVLVEAILKQPRRRDCSTSFSTRVREMPELTTLQLVTTHSALMTIFSRACVRGGELGMVQRGASAQRGGSVHPPSETVSRAERPAAPLSLNAKTRGWIREDSAAGMRGRRTPRRRGSGATRCKAKTKTGHVSSADASGAEMSEAEGREGPGICWGGEGYQRTEITEESTSLLEEEQKTRARHKEKGIPERAMSPRRHPCIHSRQFTIICLVSAKT